MIWFFLAGMIGGAVGMVMIANAWARKHIEIYYEEEKEKDDGDGV